MRTQRVISVHRSLQCLSALLTAAIPAAAGGQVDPAYLKSLAAPGKSVLVVEYYDPGGKIVDRKGFASATGFEVRSPVDIAVDAKTTLRLYGLQPCIGDVVNQKEGFVGTCSDYAKQQLQTLVRAAKVVFCRAFLTEKNAVTQDVTCFGYYDYPGSLDAVDNIEEQLVSLGALRLSKKQDGSFLRPDLEPAEKIGRGGFGMWADPRVQQQ
ncbi:hypothetical protein [Neorhizobium tomejilense]|uniref:hypothetical protein n=1 Tax=Neorhizobium tomejilense TaxID=2093828 RepID=UPI003ECEFC09